MNSADARLIGWLRQQIRTGKKTVVVSSELLENTSKDGMAEARNLATVSGVDLAIYAD